MTEDQHIKTFKQGYPFSPSAIGYGITAITIGVIMIFQFSSFLKLLSLPFFFVGIYLFFVRRELILDLKSDQIKIADSVLSMKLGTWKKIADLKGVTIKYTILTDKQKGANQYALLSPYGIMGLVRFSPNQYNRDETWLIKTIDKDGNQKQILNTGKEEALTALIHILNKNKEIKPYLAHYKKDYELKRAELAQGKLELVTPKPKRGKYY